MEGEEETSLDGFLPLDVTGIDLGILTGDVVQGSTESRRCAW